MMIVAAGAATLADDGDHCDHGGPAADRGYRRLAQVSRSVLERETFEDPRPNWTAVIELALAVMITQLDLFNRLLHTTALKAGQFGLALAPAVLLLLLWELGKLLARRQDAAA